MEHIEITLGQTVFARTADKTLLEMVAILGWPEGAKVAAQESDGGIFWWDATLEEVRIAVSLADESKELMPHLGLDKQVSLEYFSNTTNDEDPAHVAKDWRTALVTYQDFKRVQRQG